MPGSSSSATGTKAPLPSGRNTENASSSWRLSTGTEMTVAKSVTRFCTPGRNTSPHTRSFQGTPATTSLQGIQLRDRPVNSRTTIVRPPGRG